MEDDQTINSQCWMQLRQKILKKTIKVFLKGTKMVVEAEDQSDREGIYFARISAR